MLRNSLNIIRDNFWTYRFYRRGLERSAIQMSSSFSFQQYWIAVQLFIYTALWALLQIPYFITRSTNKRLWICRTQIWYIVQICWRKRIIHFCNEFIFPNILRIWKICARKAVSNLRLNHFVHWMMLLCSKKKKRYHKTPIMAIWMLFASHTEDIWH